MILIIFILVAIIISCSLYYFLNRTKVVYNKKMLSAIDNKEFEECLSTKIGIKILSHHFKLEIDYDTNWHIRVCNYKNNNKIIMFFNEKQGRDADHEFFERAIITIQNIKLKKLNDIIYDIKKVGILK